VRLIGIEQCTGRKRNGLQNTKARQKAALKGKERGSKRERLFPPEISKSSSNKGNRHEETPYWRRFAGKCRTLSKQRTTT